MPQTRLYLTAPTPEAERLFERLEAGFEDDGLPLALNETAEGSGVFELSVYADADDLPGIRNRIAGLLETPENELPFGEDRLPNIDWVVRSLEALTAVRAGRFVIHGSHERHAVRPGAIGIEIEAGQAFGTGHHGTTAGCLIMLDRLIARRRPAVSLDLGTGSAVLAIAIAKRARTPVIATDIDPVATRVAKSNARLNGVRSLIRCATARGLAHRAIRDNGPFDLIVANILARPLMAMAPAIASELAPSGDLVLSGILSAQRHKVLAAFRQSGLHHCRTIEREGWVTLHLR